MFLKIITLLTINIYEYLLIIRSSPLVDLIPPLLLARQTYSSESAPYTPLIMRVYESPS